MSAILGFAAATAVEHFRPGTLSAITLAVTVWFRTLVTRK
jgi:hypothetical protein